MEQTASQITPDSFRSRMLLVFLFRKMVLHLLIGWSIAPAHERRRSLHAPAQGTEKTVSIYRQSIPQSLGAEQSIPGFSR